MKAPPAAAAKPPRGPMPAQQPEASSSRDQTLKAQPPSVPAEDNFVDQVLLPALDSVASRHPGSLDNLNAIRAAFAALGMSNPALTREIVDTVVEKCVTYPDAC